MFTAIDYIMNNYEQRGEYVAPSLNRMSEISDDFYRAVITQAFYCCEDEKRAQFADVRMKKLSKAPPRLPKNLNDLDKIFKNRRYWSRVLNRSERLTKSLRMQYLRKLKRQFDKILPGLADGSFSVSDAKNKMIEAWNASKSRVETIFRTETTNYFAKTSVAYFESDDEIIGFLFDSTADSSRTSICKSRHGLIYRPGTRLLTLNTPSCHFNCRSHLIALANIPFNLKLLNEPQRDPSKRAVVPLPPGWRRAA